MTAAFAAALAVAVIAIAALAWNSRRSSRAILRERESAMESASRLNEANRAATESQRLANAARAELDGAVRAAEEARARASEAERRARSLQADLDAATSRSQEPYAALPAPEEGLPPPATASQTPPEPEPAPPGPPPSAPGDAKVLWELERLRCEREWSEVVGPGVDLPVPWDGGLGAVLAIEMAIIREVIGTPSHVRITSPLALPDESKAGIVVRLGLELLRVTARSGEEMTVSVGPEGVTVDQEVLDTSPPAALGPLADAARAAGGDLLVEREQGRLVARLVYPGP